MQFANPTGEAPHMDPLSDNKIWFMPSFSEKEAEKELLDRMGVENNFKNPTKFSDISDNQLQSYAGVLIPGGDSACNCRCTSSMSMEHILRECI